MKYWYYIGAAVVVILGVVFAVQFGMQGRPVPKIKLSQFKDTDNLVQSLGLRLQQEILNAPVLAIGIEPSNPRQLELINKFIGMTDSTTSAYPSILIEAGLQFREMVSKAEPLDMKVHHQRLLGILQQAKKDGQRVLLILPHIYASQLIKRSPISRIQEESGVKITSITFVPLALDRSEIDTQYFPCSPDGEDIAGLTALGCVVQNNANSWQKKKIGDAKVAGKLEQFGMSDYLFFLRLVP